MKSYCYFIKYNVVDNGEEGNAVTTSIFVIALLVLVTVPVLDVLLFQLVIFADVIPYAALALNTGSVSVYDCNAVEPNYAPYLIVLRSSITFCF